MNIGAVGGLVGGSRPEDGAVMVKFTPTEPFVPAAWVRSPNAQTIFATLARRGRRPPTVLRERWETLDGDFIDVDTLPAHPRAPHVVVLHGLEGSSRSGYVSSILQGAAQRGWGAFAINFRGCS